MIRAVAFDLWETLITEDPAAGARQQRVRLDRLERILTARGFAAQASRIEEAYRRLWDRCHELYWSDDRDVPCRRQIEHFLEGLELDVSTFSEPLLAELEHAYAHAALDVLPGVVAGATETLDDLKRRDLAIGLISNTGRTPGYVLREVLDRLGLARSIDAMVFSNEHGECKPRTSIFERLREELGVEYEEIMFVGDNLYVDVYGARRCGMRGVLFDPPVRGHAVAPPVEHGLSIEPDATITSLAEILGLLESMLREDAASPVTPR
jgi:putative hydrolase of the HAD superfamily